MWPRLFIIVVTPPLMIWIFLSELWREVRKAPWYAWNECAQEMSVIRRAWARKTIRPEDFK